MRILSAVSAVALSAGAVMMGATAVQLAGVSAAYAQAVTNVEVRGNQRVDAETIRNYLNVRRGSNYSNADIDEALKALFGTGLFSDVRISRRGSTLVVEVSEYSVVNQVLFQGNRAVKDADLGRSVQLRPRGTFSQSALEADVETIRQAYSRVGRDDAVINTQVIDLGDNRVNVVFEIQEGGRTKIAAINFVGNSAYSSRRLQEVISTKRSNLLSFVFRDDIYDEQRLRADEEALRRFYYNRGYADFRVISSFGELDQSTNQYTVTFTIEEGDRYTFGDVSVESTVPGIEADALTPLLQTRSGRVYSAEDVENTIIALTERVAGQGYAFAEVLPRGDRNFENRTISVVYTVDQGARTYIERIEIRGNSRTRDYVIRREFDISEGDAFNQVMIQRAKKRLENLNFFESVNISTVPGTQPDQVYLVVDVVEKSTGEFSVGAGYSTGDSINRNAGVNVELSVTERNFLGRGQFIRVSAGGGKGSRDYSLSFTEPYFLGRRIAAGFDIYRQTREYTNYKSTVDGATVRFGLPITEALTTQLAYNYTQEQYEYSGGGIGPDPLNPLCPGAVPGCPVAPSIQTAIALSPWVKSSVSGGFVLNTLDDIRNPREGFYGTLTGEYAGLGGDANWVKFTTRGTYYYPILDEQDIIGSVTGGAGYIRPVGSGPLRVFDYFQSNDRIIRGFEYGGIGPMANGTNDTLGGSTYFHGSVEAQFPMPALPASLGLKGALFADVATLYGNSLADANAATTGMEWRASVGASLIWASPFGPLRIDYAIPVKKLPTDKVQSFNFGISSRF